jgi:hypothetical protein
MGEGKTSIPTVTGKKRTRSGLLQLSIVIGILALVGGSFLFKVLSPQTPEDVPGQLGDMKLGSFVEGTQALAQVNQLHGTTIDLQEAYIAEYSHDFNPYHPDKARVTVWVGTSRNNNAAAALLNRMANGIAGGRGSFTEMEKVSVSGIDVFQVKGPGGEHFFYQSKVSPDRVVWLIIQDSPNTTPLVEQAIDEF